MNLFDFSLFSVGIAAQMLMLIMLMMVPLSIAPPSKKFKIDIKYGRKCHSIEMRGTDTVKQLREKVKDIVNIPLKRLIMSKYGGTSVLHDNETMDESFIRENIRNPEKICVSWDKFKIQVRFGEKEWSVEVKATDFLSVLEKKIKDLTGIPTERQKITRPDLRELSGHNMMFNGIVKGDTILVSNAFKMSVSYELRGLYDKQGSVKIELNAGDTVQIVKKKIKAMIEDERNVKLNGEMKLKKSNYEILDNDNETIEKSGIKEGVRIDVSAFWFENL